MGQSAGFATDCGKSPSASRSNPHGDNVRGVNIQHADAMPEGWRFGSQRKFIQLTGLLAKEFHPDGIPKLERQIREFVEGFGHDDG